MKFGTQTRKLALLGTVSAVALAGPAFAQSDTSGNVEQVVVTGSRLVENGYQAPTPVTVATAADLALSSPSGIDEGLRKLPQLIGSTAPNTGSGFAPNNHGNVLNLRNLGANRTLIMMDDVRVPPTTFTNTVDVDILPQLLIQRVDIVTGGASASYGSDAVAGVVNYILNTNFSGVKGSVSAGETQYGDTHTQRIGLAVGDDVLDHGHVLFSIDYYNNSGYLEQDRPWLYDQTTAVGQVINGGTPGTLSNPYYNNSGKQTGANYATVGGEITTGPFANTNFISAGVYRPVQMGQVTGSPGFYYAPTDYINQPATSSAEPSARNINMFGRFSYDLDDNTQAYVQVLGAQSITHSQGNPNIEFSPQLQIFSGNAFLPAALQAQLTATNTTMVNYTKLFTDLGPGQGYERTDNYDAMAGIKGKIDRFSWTLDYAHGASIDTVAQYNLLNLPNFYAALDSVVNPVNGQTVCYPSLSTIASVAAKYANCVPWNPFGYAAGSPAADKYILGTSYNRTSNGTDDITGSIAGDLFDLPAGPLSGAIGGTYRTQHMGMASNADPQNPPDATGERGVIANAQYYLTNQGTANAGEAIEEGFTEIGIPVLKDMPFAESFDLNAAMRVSNYSTTGEATSWKYGGTLKVNDELTLRSTRSRDIRAPTLYDLFAGALLSLSGSAIDPHTGNVQVGFNTAGGGNPNLKPEVGNTLTGGFTYQPAWLDGFAMSMDFYSIQMKRAITTLSAQQIITQCENSGGTDVSCANVIRPLPFSDHTSSNRPTLVKTAAINAAQIKTDGVDLDASYKTDLLGGDTNFRAYFGYMGEYKQQNNSLVSPADTSGYTSLPRVKGNVSVNWTKGDYTVFLQENVIGGTKLGPALNATGANSNNNLAAAISGVWVNPQLPGFYTTDLTVTWHAPPVWGANTLLFGTINNLFDAHPPNVDTNIATGNSLSTTNGLYDTTGRLFTVGVRFDTN